MQIVIAHSHLNPGGVTRIIESQVESLVNESVIVLVGDSKKPKSITSLGAELHVIQELNYLKYKKYSRNEAENLLHNVLRKIKAHLTKDSILHFHNLNLGKNPIVTYAVYLLAKEGVPVFNHAHDFAEDRPANYQFLKEIIVDTFNQNLQDVLYPDFSNYHYGVLNSFDFKRLQTYGIAKNKIEWLPNPVTFNFSEHVSNKKAAKKEICQKLEIEEAKILVTYPVRVIQRKNIGELILLSVLFEEEVNFVVTQPPKNPKEVELYKQWIKFCEQEKIQISFEAGNKVNFEKLLIASDFCISTSYQEGFGMVFLEPWLANTPVVGRDIEYITRDFINEGFEFPALYNKLIVPGYKKDFKDYDTETQKEIIRLVKNKLIQKKQLFEQNAVLNTLFDKVSISITEKNKEIIKNNYSVKGYGNKLQNRYKKMVG